MKQLSLALDKSEQMTPRSYKGIYAMHKYWSKKPSDIVANFIQRYSRPGDVVLDPFCGSGVTVIESVRLLRRSVGIDINPIAVFLTKSGLEHVDVDSIIEAYTSIESVVRRKIDKLYISVCPRCSNPNACATHYIWEGHQMKEVWLSCGKCKVNKIIKSPDQDDLSLVESLGQSANWYPQNQLIENSRINAKSGMKISDLFSNRALHALSLLLSAIERVDDIRVRNTLRLCFSAALPQTSRMIFVIRRRGRARAETAHNRAEVGSWVIGYWMPSEHFEINVWRCFENRFKRVIKGKREITKVVPRRSPATSLRDFADGKGEYIVEVGNATKLQVKSESIDYVFTDPPHGNRLPYLELSLMWNSWLGYDSVNWQDEIVVSAAKARKKDANDYLHRIGVAIAEIWRVLKPNKCMSIAFNSLEDSTWLALLNSCAHTGFQLLDIQPLRYSATSIVQDNRKNALKTDFVLTFQKNLPRKRGKVLLGPNRSEVKDAIIVYLLNLPDQCAQTYDVLNHVVVEHAKRGMFSSISLILEILEDEFEFVDSAWQLSEA